MTLASMTGFGEAERHADGFTLRWELRSVNGRSLDLKLRVPPGVEHLDQSCRALAAKTLFRGNVQAVLTIEDPTPSSVQAIDEARLSAILQWTDRLVSEGRATQPRADGLLALDGVLDGSRKERRSFAGNENIAREALDAFAEAVSALSRSRRTEGDTLTNVVKGHVERIDALAFEARKDRSRAPEFLRQRLAEQIQTLTDQPIDDARLAQELALIAVRADIGEELDRLDSHVAAAKDLLSRDGPVGRRFDFVAQEMNRESNTICSKSNAVSLSRIGLELKVTVDQLREQVQNIE